MSAKVCPYSQIYHAFNDYHKWLKWNKLTINETARLIIGYEVFNELLNDPITKKGDLFGENKTLFGLPFNKVGYIKLNEVFCINSDDEILFSVKFKSAHL